MSSVMPDAQYGSFNALRGLVRQRDPRERCDLCGTGLHLEHQHLFEPIARKLICSCDACAVLFHAHGETRYKRVPRHIRGIQDFELTDVQWDDLMIPIGMAFFVKSSVEHRVLAFYPSPAGATESMPSLTAWDEIVQQNPILSEIEPDVEALLANRLEYARAGGSAEGTNACHQTGEELACRSGGTAHPVTVLRAFPKSGEYYLVPIDKCYELVGLIRSQWRGLSGGADVWKQIRAFFEELKTRASWGSAHA